MPEKVNDMGMQSNAQECDFYVVEAEGAACTVCKTKAVRSRYKTCPCGVAICFRCWTSRDTGDVEDGDCGDDEQDDEADESDFGSDQEETDGEGDVDDGDEGNEQSVTSVSEGKESSSNEQDG